MFTLPDLPYHYDALEPYIDKETMVLHHDKHHAAYVKNLNEALLGQEELLNMTSEVLVKNLDQVPEEIRTKVKNNGGGHINHSLFWTIMAPESKEKRPEGKLLDTIDNTFGSFESFKERFREAGLARFGSGWVWLIVNNRKLSIVDTPNQDSPIFEGKTPILALDVWEHAYYLKYQNRRADYINAWWNVISWTKVLNLFTKYS